MKKKTINRVLSMIVVLTLLAGILPVNTWAVDHVHDETCGYVEPSDCTHAHDDSCGYVAAVEGVDCGHSHDAACGYSEGSAGTPCGHVHGDCGYAEAVPGTPCTHDCASGGCTLNEDGVTYTCAHTHGDCGYSEGTPASACSHTQHTDCGYAAEVPGTACNHSHDGTCGYVEAVSGNPCTHAHDEACGYSEGSDCNYVAPSTEEPEHTCSYDAYSSDEEGHWQVCTDTACAALTAKEGHTFTDDADTDCDTCGYTRIIEPAEKEETEVPVCTCGTDDEAIHATTCPLYVRPEEPRCYCAEQCTEPNVWCDVCGFDVTACEGDPAEVPTPNVTTEDGVITLTPDDLVNGASGEGWSFAENILTINSGYVLKFEGTCGAIVDNYGTIEGGTFDDKVFNRNIISGGTFTKQVANDGTIVGGTFDCNVANSDSGAIKGGNFNLSCIVENRGTIEDGSFSGEVENHGTIEGGNFSGSVSNYNGSTISGGVLTSGLGNYGTVTGTADLSNLYDLRDNGGLYGKDVKLPKAVIRGDLTYTGCESSTEITLHYYADGEKTAQWTVSGSFYSYPVERYRRTSPDADLSAIAEITHEVKAVPMDGYEITVTKANWDRFNVTVKHDHSFSNDWSHDAEYHWRAALCCNGAVSEKTAHAGGTATCTERAICSVCGASYGAEPGHVWGNWISNGDGTHTRTCANDENHTETDDCSGDEATCTQKAKCTVCATEYGSTLPHTYGTEWKSDGTNHWHECACGAKKDAAAHSGGEATCTEKAECSVCGNSYGEKDSDNHSFTKYVSDKNATCKKNGTETAKCDHGCGKTHTRTDWGSKLGHNFVNGVCTRCRLSQWNPDTGDKIMIAVTTLALSGAALLLLLVLRKKQRR